MDLIVNWLVRALHLLGAAVWLGGYAVIGLIVAPALARERSEPLLRVALALVRLNSFAGTLTILAGLVLIARTRGFGLLLGGEWGGIVISAAVLAVALMALGDSGLRPALRRLGEGQPSAAVAARRWALGGFTIAVLVLALMARAPYAA
jgi:putative copper export protein